MTSSEEPHDASSFFTALGAVGRAPILRSTAREMSGVELVERAERAGTTLDGAGLTGGDVIALSGLAAWDVLPALLAAWARTIVVAFADSREPVERITHLVEETRARLVVSEVGTATSAALDVYRREPAWLYEGGSEWPAPGRERLDLGREAATLLFTSGSSGLPKIAVHELRQHMLSAVSSAAELELRAADGWMLSLPLHHVGGLAVVFRALLTGAQLLLPEPGQPLGSALAALSPTHVSLVPTQLRRALEDPAAVLALARCRCVLVGGAPCSLALRERALARGVKLAVSYGSTESTALIAVATEPEVVLRAKSAGRLLPGRELRVSSEGELRISGSTLFAGYLEGGTLRDPRGPDGFFDTGDLGRFEADGVLYVDGRRDRMFVSGGENIYPEEIELLLGEFPGVDEAVVLPIADAEFGERPVAFVACASSAATGERLEAYLRRHLAGFKVPAAYYRLPDGLGGGLKRKLEELAALLADAKGLQRL